MVIQRALTHSNGNLSIAAKLLGVSRPTLYSLLESLGMAVGSLGASGAPS
jgi:two-component system NtrC family response regulator